MELGTNKELLNDIECVIKSGEYKVVDLEFLKKVHDIKLRKEVLEEQKGFLEVYKNYLENIKTLPDDILPLFFKTIKNDEIVSNHSLEKINPFAVSLLMLKEKKTALDKLLEIDKPLTSNDFLKLHYTLLKDTPTSLEKVEFRSENNIFVGSYVNGIRQIEYFPINYKLIPDAVKLILDYYNYEELDIEDSFIKPFIIHGLVSGIQIFKDGNTRFARMLQHAVLYESTIKFIDSSLTSPALYSSKTYYPYRGKYRYLIKNLVALNNDEAWNNWFLFNYHRFEDQVMVSEENIRELKKIL